MPEWEDEMCHICECGHNDIFHGFNNPECSICGCPEYKYEQTLSNSDADRLSKYIEDQTIKHNYVS
jgi:hypothetical protein